MMDLLIHLAASNKLNPAAHSLVVLTGDKWKQIDFKANKTIGTLAGEERQVSVQIIKKVKEDKVKNKMVAQQPFEVGQNILQVVLMCESVCFMFIGPY